MALQKGQIAREMKAFMLEANSMKQEDADKAIETYCNKLENIIHTAIKQITITIPTGFIQVQGSPAAQTNLVPIVLNNVVQ